jgi:hypothetical protein
MSPVSILPGGKLVGLTNERGEKFRKRSRRGEGEKGRFFLVLSIAPGFSRGRVKNKSA